MPERNMLVLLVGGGCVSVCLSVWSVGSTVLFKFSVSVLVFCLDALRGGERSCHCVAASLFGQRLLHIWGCSDVDGVCMYHGGIFLMNCPFYHYIRPLFSS